VQSGQEKGPKQASSMQYDAARIEEDLADHDQS